MKYCQHVESWENKHNSVLVRYLALSQVHNPLSKLLEWDSEQLRNVQDMSTNEQANLTTVSD